MTGRLLFLGLFTSVTIASSAGGCLVFDGRTLPGSPLDGAVSSDGSTSTGVITFIDAVTPGPSDQSTLAISVPPSIQAGDFLWVSMFVDKISSSVTAPSGWSKFCDRELPETDYHAFFFYRASDGSESGSYSFAIASSHLTESAVLTRYRGVDSARPPVGDCVARGIGASMTSPSIEAASAPSTILVAATNDVGCSTWSPSAPLAERSVSSDGIVFAGDLVSATSSVGGIALGCNQSSGGNVIAAAAVFAR